MARRYYRRRSHESVPDANGASCGQAAFAIFVLLMIFSAVSNPANSGQAIGLLLLVSATVIGTALYLRYREERRIRTIIDDVERLHLTLEVENFINVFGVKKREAGDWYFREHSFDIDRLRDFKKILLSKGVKLNKPGDLQELLQHYIQRKEARRTAESISVPAPSIGDVSVKQFSNLSGTEFEQLLSRLFTAMGFNVEMIGGVGDQGGDLIAVKNGERLLIQAKRYTGTVGNQAVQEAAAAKKHYSCTQALVLTTGYFSDEAVALAKSNNVTLIFRKRLQEMLLQHLRENWV